MIEQQQKGVGALADQVKSLLGRKDEQRKLLEKIDARVKSGALAPRHTLAVAVYLFGALRRDGGMLASEAEVFAMMQCGTQKLKEAKQLAEDILMMGGALGKVIREIEREMTNPEAAPQEKTGDPETQETMASRIKRLANASFVHDKSLKSNARKLQEKQARRAIALIARRSLRKYPETGSTLTKEMGRDNFDKTLSDAEIEYAQQGAFHRLVQAICNDLDIPAP
ncbi:hypothetical protein A3C21_03775 [Candidatus Kaiserbacteria bacterium RIFCSPHIGHO2_02_FULL_59_21]|uniref:Uncharacterized protein n=1 Tax=Candidatus Kaiserbacteria bacterium RIFCSPHIGHO2_02_FULL_59_21 TaxID=1798500 RepID=A0A1F6E0F0_9BACT|nr:MAG: hypothetical protein A2766_01270 [Candidatus Kaiserbacteria bacterium RIFCSPHIGHO2_01_FULL_58_22]OGG67141.1 MAG: hypothetical protein A3C21_03775 [Candidatus Kaiserbacteria bacterium RIFCSPHIGHO2_02_FULL_59_21]OGG79063.1 MAG: hypothetical protein A2952_02900 [Candidatus Kaiserbacteria bacterium RIFCSPLOWO2_01_FULL_59_34]OGG86334.1 MAG: hypothetical protein A3I47_01165 [Candidatus Kaiserbacteria bacterium RIFCSPLOWO2_02_FULL_59_19]